MGNSSYLFVFCRVQQLALSLFVSISSCSFLVFFFSQEGTIYSRIVRVCKVWLSAKMCCYVLWPTDGFSCLFFWLLCVQYLYCSMGVCCQLYQACIIKMLSFFHASSLSVILSSPKLTVKRQYLAANAATVNKLCCTRTHHCYSLLCTGCKWTALRLAEWGRRQKMNCR